MQRSTNVLDDGSISSCYWCDPCDRVVQKVYKHGNISPHCDEFPEFGEVRSWLLDPEYFGLEWLQEMEATG